jgi:TRAP-type mannitol/chloroaromatic compound transport system substrate-binding protein
VDAASADLSWEGDRPLLEGLRRDGVQAGRQVYKTPDPVLAEQLTAYDAVADKKAGENALFKKIVESQKAFAVRAVRWDMDNNVNRRMAYNHYFGKKPAAPAAPKKA